MIAMQNHKEAKDSGRITKKKSCPRASDSKRGGKWLESLSLQGC